MAPDWDPIAYSANSLPFNFNMCVAVNTNNDVFILSSDSGIGPLSGKFTYCLDNFVKGDIVDLGFSVKSRSVTSVVLENCSTGEEVCYSLIPNFKFTHNNEDLFIFVNTSLLKNFNSSETPNNFNYSNYTYLFEIGENRVPIKKYYKGEEWVFMHLPFLLWSPYYVPMLNIGVNLHYDGDGIYE